MMLIIIFEMSTKIQPSLNHLFEIKFEIIKTMNNAGLNQKNDTRLNFFEPLQISFQFIRIR